MQPPDTLVVWMAACQCEHRAAEEQARRARYEAEQRLLNHRFAQAHLDERFLNATFDNFELVAGTEFAVARCREFVERFSLWRKEGRGLLLAGGNGCGKTHLVSAIVHTLTREHGHACLFVTMVDYYDQLRRHYDIERAGGISSGDIQDSAAAVTVLALDDISAERLPTDERGDWIRERLYALVDRRYRRMLPLVTTMNCSDADLEERVGARIFRRLMEMLEIVPIPAGNYAERQR